MQRNKKAILGALAGAVSLAVVLAGCGSSSKDSGSSPSGGSNVATGTPVTIGAMTQSAGSAGLPDPKQGLEGAVWYVNNELGGLGGHPVKIDLCEDDGTPATEVACGNQFVSNHDPVVLDTYDAGIGSAAPALLAAKIPFVGEVSGDSTVETNANPAAFYWTGPLAITAAGIMPMMQSFNVKTANFVGPDLTPVHTYFDKVLIPMGKRIGITINATYIDPTTTSFDSVAATLEKGSPDIIGNLALSEDQVTSLISSLRTQGWTKPLFGGSASKFVTDLPSDESAGVTIIPRTWLPPAEAAAPQNVKDQLDAFKNAMQQAGYGDMDSARSIYSFTALVNLAQILNTQKVTDITTDNITAAIEATKDQPSFLGPTMTCDGKIFPGYPTACADQGIFFTVQPDGSYKPGVPDGFQDLDIKTLFGL